MLNENVSEKAWEELRAENARLRSELDASKWTESQNHKKIKLLQKSLYESAALKRALDESTVFNITNRDGKIIHANDEFCEISQYSREELFGESHGLVNSGYHPEEFFREMWQTISSCKVWHGEIRNKAKDGSFFWLNTTIVPVLDSDGKPNYYLGIRSDVTPDKLREIKGEETKLRAILETAIDSIITIDERGEIETFNPASEQIFGYDADEVIGKNVSILMPSWVTSKPT